MRTSLRLALLGLLAATACERAASAGGATGTGPAAGRPLARRCALPHRDGWCPVCGVGYVAAIPVPSRDLFDVLDAHGHDVDPKVMTCASCKEAWRTGGYCEECRMGFVRGQAYLSRLTYHVARSAVEDPERIACEVCKANAADRGWCERCGVGRTGVLVIRDRAEVEDTWRAVRKLRRALELLPRCETCAVAAFADGRCRECGVSYREGEAVREDSASS